MKSILYFSTAFMNRMSYAYKFGVVSILFFLALSGVSYQLFVEMNKEITHTKNELAGLELLETQIEMRKALGHYISSVWAIDQARPVTMETPESLVDSFRRDIGISNQAIENTIEKSRDFVSIAGHKSAEQLEKLSDLWKTSAQLNPVGDAVTNINYTRERELIGLSNRVIRSASMGASLAQDSDPQIFLLAELITKSLPELVVSLEELRGTSMAALALGSRTTTDVITGLETGLDVIMNDTSAFTSMADSIMDLGQLDPSIVNQIKKVSTMYSDLGPYIEDNLIVGMGTPLSPEDFDTKMTANIDEIYQLIDVIIPVVKVDLEARLSARNSSIFMLAAALALVVVLVAYLYAGFFVSVKATVGQIYDAAHKMAEGDMTVHVDVQSNDEMGDLSVEFNKMAENVHKLIQGVRETTQQVTSQSDQVEKIASRSSEDVSKQLLQTEQVATAMNEMTATVQEVARNSVGAANTAKLAHKEADDGKQLVISTLGMIDQLSGEINTSVEVINCLVEDSNNISQVLDVIKSIAEQTNLLALNAAIEAARAGEHGRGFAVVADEVRTLAQKTQESTTEIESMISRLQSGVDNAVSTMGSSRDMASNTVEESNKVGEALNHIVSAVTDIMAMNQQIATASEEQSSVANEIDRNIVSINTFGEQTSRGATETVDASREMSELTGKLDSMVSAFKV
ncbi:MAG: methyl-accepting chemotaxis protein [Pseudomonadales bacterium]|nr:methyl-accepting chemotaxis protein [Pseudomonadales bacterium]